MSASSSNIDNPITDEQILAEIDTHAATLEAVSETFTFKGHTLRRLTPAENLERGFTNGEEAAEVDNGRIAVHDGDGRWWYIDDDSEVLAAAGYDYGGQAHYNYTGAATIVEIAHVVVGDMGNPQAWKLESLRTGIRTGAQIPPVSVTAITTAAGRRYRLEDGYNRLSVSQEGEFGFTQIPATVAGS